MQRMHDKGATVCFSDPYVPSVDLNGRKNQVRRFDADGSPGDGLCGDSHGPFDPGLRGDRQAKLAGF
jgi:hypothetical protein